MEEAAFRTLQARPEAGDAPRVLSAPVKETDEGAVTQEAYAAFFADRGDIGIEDMTLSELAEYSGLCAALPSACSRRLRNACEVQMLYKLLAEVNRRIEETSSARDVAALAKRSIEIIDKIDECRGLGAVKTGFDL